MDWLTYIDAVATRDASRREEIKQLRVLLPKAFDAGVAFEANLSPVVQDRDTWVYAALAAVEKEINNDNY